MNCLLSVLCLQNAQASDQTEYSAPEQYKQNIQFEWIKQINQQAEAVTRHPESVANQVPNLILEKTSDQNHRQKLESYYQSEDFDGLQSFGEQRAKQLETEPSPEGEAWRLLHQSPDRYYPDANEHKILKPMELSINALQHPNTWSKQKHWPADAYGNPVYDQNSEMSATIARLRQHFKGCDYQKKLILKKDRQVHSPDIRECTRAVITDSNVTLHREIEVQPFAEFVSGSTLAQMKACESQSAHEGCIQIHLGQFSGADQYRNCGHYLMEQSITLDVSKPQALNRVILEKARWGKRMQLWFNNKKAWQSHKDFPLENDGICQFNSNHRLNSPIILDIPKTLPNNRLGIRIKALMGDHEGSHAYARVKLYFDIRQLLDVKTDRWTPISALEQLQNMRLWQQHGLCRLSYQCLTSMSDAERTIYGRLIPLRASLSPQLPVDCKTARVRADCFYYKKPHQTVIRRIAALNTPMILTASFWIVSAWDKNLMSVIPARIAMTVATPET